MTTGVDLSIARLHGCDVRKSCVNCRTDSGPSGFYRVCYEIKQLRVDVAGFVRAFASLVPEGVEYFGWFCESNSVGNLVEVWLDVRSVEDAVASEVCGTKLCVAGVKPVVSCYGRCRKVEESDYCILDHLARAQWLAMQSNRQGCFGKRFVAEIAGE